MKHPGTFNANPLSAAAGITTLRIVSGGEPCQKANEMAQLLRGKLNEMFAARGLDWIAYGEFSSFKLLPNYQGPRPREDAFIPYKGDPTQLGAPVERGWIHGFRQAMLLHGVDLPGLGGMTMTAHAPADVDRTVAAVAGAVEMLAAE
jgi:glutamate-1-semialdehyde 2,1-aminomutase